MENKNEENDDKKEDKKEEKKEEKKDGKDQKEEKDDNEIEKDKKYKKNKRRNFSPHNIDNKQDSKTFMDNLKIFDKNFKEKVPNINNRPVNSNINQIRNTEDDFEMNINETLIDPYPNLDTNPFRQNGDYLNLAQNQEQINLLRIIADNLRNGENQRGISYSIILIGYIFCFVFLTNHFRNHGGFNYSASISLYCMVVALSCLISVIYLKEIRKANKNK